MQTSKKLIFFGTESFSLPSLSALIEADLRPALVVTKPDSRSGRGQQLKSPAVKVLAIANTITVVQPSKVSNIISDLKDLKPDLGILVAYGKIIPPEIIELFPLGIVNIHPSLLPKYRGPSPIEAAIINGDEETGVSLMKLSAEMDAGPIYKQTTVKLTGNETKPELYCKLAELGAEMLIKYIGEILAGKLEPVDQDHSKATYTKLLHKDDGLVSWSEPAKLIDRNVRAYLGFPKSKAKVFNRDIVITRGHVASTKSDVELSIATAEDYYVIDELIAPSGRKMSGQDFIRGYGKS